MSGGKLFIDTNIALYLLSGDKTLATLLHEKELYISFITTDKDFKKVKELDLVYYQVD